MELGWAKKTSWKNLETKMVEISVAKSGNDVSTQSMISELGGVAILRSEGCCETPFVVSIAIPSLSLQSLLSLSVLNRESVKEPMKVNIKS